MKQKPAERKQPAEASSSGPEELTPPPVKLRPVFGVAPEHYLPALFVTIIALVFAAIFMVPALRNPGVNVRVHSTPAGSAVYIDGRRVGSTPTTVFLDRGAREVRLTHPWFADESFTYEAGNQVFRVPFRPRTRPLSRRLELRDPHGLLTAAASEFAHWALGEPPTVRRPRPAVLTDAVRAWYAEPEHKPLERDTLLPRIGPNRDAHPADAEELTASDLLRVTGALLEHEGAAADYLGALATDRAAGGVVSGPAVLEIVHNIIHLQNSSHAFFELLAAVTPADLDERVAASDWYRGARERLDTAIAAASQEEVPIELDTPGLEEHAEVEFVRVPAVESLIGMQRDAPQPLERLRAPHVVKSGEFRLMRAPVSNALFERFLADRPEWGPEHTEELREQGLVTQDHLAEHASRPEHATGGQDAEGDATAEFDLETWLRQPVRYVSYPVAEAFVSWFNERLADEGGNFVARLPSSEEWELVAQLDGADLFDPVFRNGFLTAPAGVTDATAGNLGFYHLMGNTWEWTASAFLPADYALRPFHNQTSDLASTREPLQDAIPFRAVRGGSWANRPDDVSLAAVGAQPKYWSSPFLSFRVALVAAEE